MSNEEKIDKWIKEHEGSDDLCEFCKYRGSCSGEAACYGGEPIFPHCVENSLKECLDMDLILEDIENVEAGGINE